MTQSWSLHDLQNDSTRVESQLRDAGLGDADNIEAKVALYAQAAAALVHLTGEDNRRQNAAAFWVPGRVELAGKHTDYAGGWSLLAATPRGFCVVVNARDDAECRVVTLDSSVPPDDRVAHISLAGDGPLLCGIDGVSSGHWSRYARVCLARLGNNFKPHLGQKLRGVDLALGCDLPVASGMSTSSALICALFLAFDFANDLRASPAFLRLLPDDASLVEYLGCCENGKDFGDREAHAAGTGPWLQGNGGVGTFGGSEDHAAIMTCRANTVHVYRFCPTRCMATVEVAPGVALVVGSSGVVAAKTGGAMARYNTAASDAARVAAALGFATMGEGLRLLGAAGCRDRLASLLVCRLDAGIAGLDAAQAGADLRRFRQFELETDVVVPGLAEALGAGDGGRGGRLMDESHARGAEALTNLVEATGWLARRAKAIGASGATAFGAGFGGSVVALVPAADAARFAAAWERDYGAAFPENRERAVFFAMRPGPGASRI